MDVEKWSIAQLKDWLRQNSPETPLSGRKLVLVSKVRSLQGTKALAEVLEAKEVKVNATISVSWHDLPPDANPGWLIDVMRFPSMPSEVIEAYLKNLGGYSKN